MEIKKFQLVIPMTGEGSRFKAAGYEVLKPFIEIHGKPMIEWVSEIFKNIDCDVFYILREEHLAIPYVLEFYQRKCNNIILLKNWKKRGPVVDILSSFTSLRSDSPILVSYCDYFMLWKDLEFITTVMTKDIAGAIPCYSGFHPHLIKADNLYASCLTDQFDNLIEIKEKFSFEVDKKKSKHSPGLYYFKTKDLMKYSFEELITSKYSINGEFYVSLAYNFLVQSQQTVWCPVNVEYFCQWGTPEDLNDYLIWSKRLGRSL